VETPASKADPDGHFPLLALAGGGALAEFGGPVLVSNPVGWTILGVASVAAIGYVAYEHFHTPPSTSTSTNTGTPATTPTNTQIGTPASTGTSASTETPASTSQPGTVETTPLANSKSTTPVGVTSAGQKINAYAEKLGRNGTPMRHSKRHSTTKRAKDAARQEGKTAPEKHGGDGHFYPTDAEGNKLPNATHHEYPH
jgi:hypothetical protein